MQGFSFRDFRINLGLQILYSIQYLSVNLKKVIFAKVDWFYAILIALFKFQTSC